jgi:hypothetical protein
MFDFGKSLINMDPDEQKKMLGNATSGQRRVALEMGIGFNNQNQQQQQRQEQQDVHKQQNSDSNAPEGLGDLSGKYESGKDGSHAISSGEEDLGGKSYGKYQMTSVHNGKAGGTAQKFVTSEGFPWKDEFKGLTAGSKEFDKQWEKLADEHPEELEKLQDKFIYDTHYVPVAKSVREYGLDADK